jgi:hypothetical protein
MTTTITVKANHGWPVRVTAIDPKTKAETPAPTVAAGEHRDFSVHSGSDLLIHEIQPGEAESQPQPQ